MIEIDASSGGGQLLRTALSLSMITKASFKMKSIRKKRENPGLQAQHLTCVQAAKKISQASVEGDVLKSEELIFRPKGVNGGSYEFNIGTAGSTTLVFQTLLPALIFAQKESQISIIGGTANPLAPPALEIKEVFLELIKKIGVNVDFQIVKEGFYPKGGGKVLFKVQPVKEIKPISLLERGFLKEVSVFAVCSEDLQKASVASRLIKGFKGNEKIKEKEMYCYTESSGCYIHVNATFQNTKIGFTALGKKGKPAEEIGKECGVEFEKELTSSATIDPFSADQLLIYLALAGKGVFVTSQITEHLLTNIEIIEKFLPVEFKISGNKVECYSLADVVKE